MATPLPTRLGYFFYMVSPNATTFKNVEDVPNYQHEAFPLLAVFLILEWVMIKAKNKNGIKIGCTLSSLGIFITFEAIGMIIRGTSLIGYEWFYKHRLIDLNWDSPVTWCLAALGADLGYYWYHRFSHEVNIVWAGHQAHHSSEYYNFFTAIRQSRFARYFIIGVYNPLALFGVPLPAMLVHLHFNIIYQLWTHTQLIKNCGPLEWILVTPSHHRVHHGANKYCLDKNYGGVLIIWDRMFGTFEPERRDEEIVYGLVTQPQSFNGVWLQIFYFQDIIKKVLSMDTLGDKLRAVFYGPGWVPGAPRLGNPATFPDVKAPRAKYDPQLPLWNEIYVIVHFVIILIVQKVFVTNFSTFSWFMVLAFLTFILLSVGIIGAMFDGWWWAPLVEAARCAAYVAYARSNTLTSIPVLDSALLVYFAVSAMIWTSRSLSMIKSTSRDYKLK